MISIFNTITDSFANTLKSALDISADPGKIKIYGGVKPANANTGVSGQPLLATLTLSKPCGTVNGSQQLVFSEITGDLSADATGTATWARFTNGDGTTVMDVDVGDTNSSAFLKLNTTSVTVGKPVNITSITISF